MFLNMYLANRKYTFGGEQPTVWVDGCYDMAHFGHANSFRQARALGSSLTVGIHSDAEITAQKRQPVLTQDERLTMVKSMQWVTNAVIAPYVTQVGTMDQYLCDICVHGNDISTTTTGEDTYQEVKDQGRYKEVERTYGISTTDLVKRILRIENDSCDKATGQTVISPYTGEKFYLTAEKIAMFLEPKRVTPPKEFVKTVYTQGIFDLFHPGHLCVLEEASKMGDRLIVGIYDDETVKKLKGSTKYPIMTLNERVLSVLACKYVDNVVIGAPRKIQESFLKEFNIQLVVKGAEPTELNNNWVFYESTELDPYEVPKMLGMYDEVKRHCTLTTTDLIRRVLSRRAIYESRNAKKEKKEVEEMMNKGVYGHDLKGQDFPTMGLGDLTLETNSN